MNPRIEDVASDLSSTAAEAKELFGRFSDRQLNWKPSENQWSVAQCLDHLITTHGLYFPLLERLAAGGAQATWWEKWSPLSGPFGKLLIQSMHPENEKKIKTTAKAEPAASRIERRIVDRFVEHQDGMIEHLKKLPEGLDLEKTIITSPLMGIITYSLDDCLTIFVVHSQRHLGQAERVTQNAGFPG